VSADLTAAVLERLTDQFPPGVAVFDTDVPGVAPTRYVVVFGDVGKRSSDAIDGVSRQVEFRVTAMCVSPSTLECRRFAQGAQDALIDWTPSVDGLVCSQVSHYDRQPAKRDESIAERHISFAVEIFSLYANRVS
jgi:hypothetical protein